MHAFCQVKLPQRGACFLNGLDARPLPRLRGIVLGIGTGVFRPRSPDDAIEVIVQLAESKCPRVPLVPHHTGAERKQARGVPRFPEFKGAAKCRHVGEPAAFAQEPKDLRVRVDPFFELAEQLQEEPLAVQHCRIALLRGKYVRLELLVGTAELFERARLDCADRAVAAGAREMAAPERGRGPRLSRTLASQGTLLCT